MKILLMGGPRDGVVIDGWDGLHPGHTIKMPIRIKSSATAALTEGRDFDDAEFETADYEVRMLEHAQAHETAGIVHAVGDYVLPPLACGHSRERGPWSAFRDTRALFEAYSAMPLYAHHVPVFCACGLMVAMRHTIDLLADLRGWNEWRAERLKDLGQVVDELESLARYARRPHPEEE